MHEIRAKLCSVGGVPWDVCALLDHHSVASNTGHCRVVCVAREAGRGRDPLRIHNKGDACRVEHPDNVIRGHERSLSRSGRLKIDVTSVVEEVRSLLDGDPGKQPIAPPCIKRCLYHKRRHGQGPFSGRLVHKP